MEIFKDIKGYEGYYQISNLGTVKTLDRTIVRSDGVSQNLKSRVTKQRLNWNGYLIVSLSKQGINKIYLVHRLIAIHFIENPKGKNLINHKNKKITDNSIENLEWVDYSENRCHGILDNKKNMTSDYFGVSFSKCAKKYEAYVSVNCKKKYLGLFETAIDAHEARLKYQLDNNIHNSYELASS